MPAPGRGPSGCGPGAASGSRPAPPARCRHRWLGTCWAQAWRSPAPAWRHAPGRQAWRSASSAFPSPPWTRPLDHRSPPPPPRDGQTCGVPAGSPLWPPLTLHQRLTPSVLLLDGRRDPGTPDPRLSAAAESHGRMDHPKEGLRAKPLTIRYRFAVRPIRPTPDPASTAAATGPPEAAVAGPAEVAGGPRAVGGALERRSDRPRDEPAAGSVDRARGWPADGSTPVQPPMRRRA